MKVFLIHIVCFLCFYPVLSQVTQENYIDAGKNNVSAGTFLRLTSVSSYEIKNYRAQTGFLFSFSNQNNKRFTGWFLNASGNFKIKKSPLKPVHFTGLIHFQI